MTKKLTTNYGALEDAMQPHMRPLNRDAFNAVFIPREDRYTSNVKISQAHWDTPPETKRAPKDAPNLIGTTFGRFKVIGYLGRVGKSGPAGAWLVRCSCGKYEYRRAKAIRSPKNTTDACLECRHVMTLRKRERWRMTGRDQTYEDVV